MAKKAIKERRTTNENLEDGLSLVCVGVWLACIVWCAKTLVRVIDDREREFVEEPNDVSRERRLEAKAEPKPKPLCQKCLWDDKPRTLDI